MIPDLEKTIENSKNNKDEDKITQYLLNNGFSIKLIQKVKEDYGFEK